MFFWRQFVNQKGWNETAFGTLTDTRRFLQCVQMTFTCVEKWIRQEKVGRAKEDTRLSICLCSRYGWPLVYIGHWSWLELDERKTSQPEFIDESLLKVRLKMKEQKVKRDLCRSMCFKCFVSSMRSRHIIRILINMDSSVWFQLKRCRTIIFDISQITPKSSFSFSCSPFASCSYISDSNRIESNRSQIRITNTKCEVRVRCLSVQGPTCHSFIPFKDRVG